LTGNAKNQLQLSPETLIPISFIVVLTGAIYFIAQLNSLAHSNQERLTQVDVKRQKVDIRLFDRLKVLEDDVSDIRSDVGSANGKLDILLELRTNPGIK
jgi:hypothetical protein